MPKIQLVGSTGPYIELSRAEQREIVKALQERAENLDRLIGIADDEACHVSTLAASGEMCHMLAGLLDD